MQESAGPVFNLFPTPLKKLSGVCGELMAARLAEELLPRVVVANSSSSKLAHSAPLAADEDPVLAELAQLLLPHVSAFGALLLGEALDWHIKEMWLNVLEPGGRQGLHNHANSFVSGVIYLTRCHPSTNTVFVRAPGGSDFVFQNANARVKLGPYNADKWVAPDPQPGDVVLFPSYLLHEVPENRGARRVSLAFNAIPSRLDSWGYTLSLSR
jgi:uncharacterized protein (TIGR02466 family)